MDDFEPVIRFIAASDIHYDRSRPQRRKNFEKGLALAYEYAQSQEYKRIDALYVNGDFSNGGREEQMQDFHETLKNCVKPETEITLTMASHEFMDEGGEDAAHEKFGRIFGMQPDCHKIIGGFHFISVTTTHGCSFNEEKRAFISQELKRAGDNPFKPIFFFQHPHISGTVYGSINWGEDEITDILMNYPQIIDFSGHSHAPINDPRSIHQQHFTCVGTGSFSYFELDEFDKIYGTVPPQEHDAAQFLIVEADENGRVLIKPFDVLTERFFPCERLVETPWEPDSFIYTDARFYGAPKPHFAPEAKLKIEVENENAKFVFTQAEIEKDFVNDYKITVRRKYDGAIVRQACVWSGYYFNNMPTVVSQVLENFESGEYSAKIKARGFWNNVSDNALEADFEIK